MISMLDGCELAGYDADTVNRATTLTLIAGATDTNTITLTWAMSLLLNHPHVLKKAQEELDTLVGRDRLVKDSDIDKLQYIQAIVKETLRIHPPGPLSGPREFTEDCTLGGYQISKGTRLITNLWKIQTDPNFWPDPLVFNPDRFLTTNKGLNVRGQHFEYIPFGSGRRICPAISFALHMVQFTLASFLHSFEFSRPSEEPIDMSENIGMTNLKATPLEVLVEPRLSPEVWKTL
ncbi:hypothetical protein L6164_012134 [Bauhinia variegata]|uniref:Uncharacterized protein n=1 Tax=Bauhinia variegata TaxID=167791 RepID=A0ACB9P8X5_BAUVA|nr:hypothetical protein L6164_012134 [Bauhinia variegata]